VSIGINLPVYPQLVRVPGYPVYYAPRLQANYFFYDGMYWVYQDDNWYASSWYNGPWGYVDSEVVPLFILRIPVRYYRQPPAYFYGWRPDAPPRWGDHWGPNWEQHRSGWDRWNHRAAPAPAPLPVYQRQYSGNRYPQQVQQQHELQQRNYRYQPRDPVVRQSYQEQAEQRTRAQQGTPQQERQGAPERRDSRQQDIQRSMPRQQIAPPTPRPQPPQRGGENMQRPAPAAPQQRGPGVQERRQPPQPNVNQREQQMQRSQGQEEKQQGKDATREPKRGQGQGQGQGQDRGRDRNE
ncbi:MAG TPA: hypothetical protein DCQ77_09155, partial [Betaproteobacteria bacterium]|nr:hypothetical protein [Betaproteobacteria bacterium]